MIHIISHVLRLTPQNICVTAEAKDTIVGLWEVYTALFTVNLLRGVNEG